MEFGLQSQPARIVEARSLPGLCPVGLKKTFWSWSISYYTALGQSWSSGFCPPLPRVPERTAGGDGLPFPYKNARPSGRIPR